MAVSESPAGAVAAELRAQGLTLREIGDRLGLTYQGAAHLLRPVTYRRGKGK